MMKDVFVAFASWAAAEPELRGMALQEVYDLKTRTCHYVLVKETSNTEVTAPHDDNAIVSYGAFWYIQGEGINSHRAPNRRLWASGWTIAAKEITW
jgi:hypothetical protein